MKFSVMSDLHLEFGPFDYELPGGDVCLLAGDILVARAMRPQSEVPGIKEHWAKFKAEQLSKYKKVYMIMGNHEHYGSAFSNTRDTLQEAVGADILYLNNETVVLSDTVALFASTFWTDLNNNDYFAKYTAKFGMNDYRAIKVIDAGVWRRLHPDDTFDENMEARNALAIALAEHADKQFVVMTHHTPDMRSCHPRWGKENNPLNFSYSNTGIEPLVLGNENLKFWVHGHTHECHDYMIGQCRVLCNPRGYYGHEQTGFDPNLQFELE